MTVVDKAAVPEGGEAAAIHAEDDPQRAATAPASGDLAYEMLWDCKFCGQQKLLGVTHRHCPACGAPQNADERYFPPDAEKVLARDHQYSGADVVCAHCGDANGKKASHCGGCGAPLEAGKGVARRADQIHEANAAFGGQTGGDARRERRAAGEPVPLVTQQKPPLRRFRVVVTVLALTLLVLAGVLGVSMFWKREGGLTVTGHAWHREIAIESFGPVPASAWCEQVPAEANGVRRAREVRSRERVADGQTCKTKKVDRGDGTFVEKEICSPRYKQEPVYDDKCYYAVNRWRQTRKLEAEGRSLTDAPRWPDVTLVRPGTCDGCEREGLRQETLLVEFVDPKATKHTCPVGADAWIAMGEGSAWTGKFRVIGGALDCETLVRK